MKLRLSVILAGALLMLIATQDGNPQTAPRVTIETGTGDALVMTSTSNHTWRIGPNSGSGAGFGLHDETAGTTRLKIDLNGNVGIGTTAPQTPLEVMGPIYSASGGFVFPDGTTQTTAARGNYAAGSGLTLSGTTFSIATGGVGSTQLANAAVQTSNIADGAITSQKLSTDLLGGVQQVIHGVVTFNGNSSTDVTETFSPSIDPAKSYVIVGIPVFAPQLPQTVATRLGATLVGLTANSITLAVDTPIEVFYHPAPCRVSFQIIQFK